MRGLQQLVDAADSAALLLAVDGLVATRDWDDLADLARRCREAVELGRQLWPVAQHIEYRLALEAPAAHAAAVLRAGAARFALGPLTEVAASTHDWDSLAPHLPDPVAAGAVAQERVLRGESLTGRTDGIAAAPELPLAPASWEPSYALPRYRDRSAAFPQPEVSTRSLPAPAVLPVGERLAEDDGVRALLDLAEPWVTQSSGTSRAVAVAGDAPHAVGTLLSAVADRAAEAALVPITPAEALSLLQWTAASGGAYGRRRGGASGRFAAWWTAAALAGIEWPTDPADGGATLAAELGDAIAELAWYRWRRDSAETGWVLRVAVADPVDGLAWAVEAVDQRDDDVMG